jgi:hypothetical protein
MKKHVCATPARFRARHRWLSTVILGRSPPAPVARTSDSSEAQTEAPPVQSLPPVEISAARKRLDAARNGLSPDTGSSIYRVERQDLDNLPLGENTPLNQVILQTPGVVQDSYGQLHVRGDHANVQYRINGVIIPESISGFGQALETRLVDHLSIPSGVLPAQYGYRNAAVIDLQSKQGELENGGSAGFTGRKRSKSRRRSRRLRQRSTMR